MSQFAEVVARLAAVIESRKAGDATASYTAKLLADPALAAESADLIYHWLVVLAAAGVSLDEVAAKLEAREGASGLAEKASRPK